MNGACPFQEELEQALIGGRLTVRGVVELYCHLDSGCPECEEVLPRTARRRLFGAGLSPLAKSDPVDLPPIDETRGTAELNYWFSHRPRVERPPLVKVVLQGPDFFAEPEKFERLLEEAEGEKVQLPLLSAGRLRRAARYLDSLAISMPPDAWDIARTMLTLASTSMIRELPRVLAWDFYLRAVRANLEVALLNTLPIQAERFAAWLEPLLDLHDDPCEAVETINTLGLLEMRVGRPDSARKLLAEGAALAKETGGLVLAGKLLANRATVYLAEGRPAEALEGWLAAEQVLRDAGAPPHLIEELEGVQEIVASGSDAASESPPRIH